MSLRTMLVTGALAGILSWPVHAGAGQAGQATGGVDPETLQTWRFDAMAGDAEKQERLAGLLLGPQAGAVGATKVEGVHFLLRAAIAGRPGAMRRLADALDRGRYGLRRLPEAARCWSALPADAEARLACVRQTDFRNPRHRVPCSDLTVMPDQARSGASAGVAMARLCLANKTPALLVPGGPPGPEGEERARQYAKHGIEWSITGDVYEEEFERYRNDFNRTMVEGIEAQRGTGYLQKLDRQIDARLARQRKAGQ